MPASAGPAFVTSLCGLSDVVLFSAAQPGQGGEQHLNERAPSYWAGQFAANGYAAFDCVRPRVRDEASVDPWYKFNTVLYANARGQERLLPAALAARIDDLGKLDGAGDLAWKLRCAILRPLPEPVVTTLSRWRYSLVCALSAGQSQAGR